MPLAPVSRRTRRRPRPQVAEQVTTGSEESTRALSIDAAWPRGDEWMRVLKGRDHTVSFGIVALMVIVGLLRAQCTSTVVRSRVPRLRLRV